MENTPVPFSLILILLCMGVLAFRQAQAAPAEHDTISWPDQGPYRTVGQKNFRTIRMPVPVAEAVQRTIPDDPATWEIIPLVGSPYNGKRILEISGEKTFVNLLVRQGRWINLTAPAAVLFLNDALSELHLADLRSEEKLSEYLVGISRLHCGSVILLLKDFERQRLTDARIGYWLGSEKRPEALHALCHDLIVAREEGRITIQSNLLLLDGSVERWTFHLRMGKAVRLESIDRVRLHKKGSFYYALGIARSGKFRAGPDLALQIPPRNRVDNPSHKAGDVLEYPAAKPTMSLVVAGDGTAASICCADGTARGPYITLR